MGFRLKTTGQRCLLAVVILALPLSAALALASWRAHEHSDAHEALDMRYSATAALDDARANIFLSALNIGAAAFAEDPTLFEQQFRDSDSAAAQDIARARAALVALGETEEVQIIDQISAEMDQIRQKTPLLPSFSELPVSSRIEMLRELQLSLWPQAKNVLGIVNGLVSAERERLLDERGGTISTSLSLGLLLGCCIIAFIAGSAAFVLVLVSIVRPLQSLKQDLKAVSSEKAESVRVSGPEEVADVALHINEMMQRHREMDDALRESDERYRTLFDRSLEAVYVHDFEGHFLDANEMALRLLGYTREEIPRISFADVLDDSQMEIAGGVIRELIETGRQKKPVCYRARRKDGTLVEIETVAAVMQKDGRPYAVQGVARDITERRVTEQALMESEERLRTVAANAPIALFAFDGDGIITFQEGRGLESLGMKPGELVGQSAFDLTENIPEIPSAVSRVLAGKSVSEVVEMRGGVFEVRYTPISDGNRHVKGGIGVAIDVSRRKRVEDALRESEGKYRHIFETVQDIFYRTDGSGIITEISPSVSRWGYKREELIGTQVLDVYENPKQRSKLLKVLFERGEVTDFEVRLKGGNGDVFDSSVGSHVIRAEDGTVLGVEGFLRDISERKRMEQALREQMRRDPLTGVLNHAAIVAEMRKLISGSRRGAPCAVLMTDVDALKATNDTYGHQVGDKLLQAVARCLTRRGAIVGRYGGDEFVSLLTNSGRNEGERYREEVLSALAKVRVRDRAGGAPVSARVSIGLAVAPTEANRIEDLIHLADGGMYAAKRQRPVNLAITPQLDDPAARVVGQIVPLLTSSGELGEKLRLVAHRLSLAGSYDAVGFVLFSANARTTLVDTFARLPKHLLDQWNEEQRKKGKLLLSTRVLLEQGRPAILNDLQNEVRLCEKERGLLAAAGLRSGIAAPMIWQDELIGVLSVASKRADSFGPVEAQFLMAVTAQVTAIVSMSTLLERVQSASARISQAHADTVLLLAAAAEAHDRTTGRHLQNVRRISEKLALELGWKPEAAEEMGLAAVLHDIGKIRVADSVLANEGRLTDQEWQLMRQHSIWGEEFLAGRTGFELAATIARCHHERWDGQGYPDGLSGRQIPEAASIVAVADAFDAMISDRPYRPRRSVAAAIREVAECSGGQFSPEVVKAMLRLYSRRGLYRLTHQKFDEKAA